MNLRKVLIFLLMTFFPLYYSSSWCQINYYSSKNIYLFAEHLYQNGDFLRAAGEFQRYSFLINAPDLSDSLLYKIGLCYQLGSKPKKAIHYYQSLISDFPQSRFIDSIHYKIACIYFETEKYDESIEYIENKNHTISSKNVNLRMNQILGVNYLYQRRWKTADNHFSKIISTNTADSLTNVLKNYAIEGLRIPYKSKAIAGLMSTVIPGTGKMYGGRVADGFYSLIIVGLTGWQAYEGFSKKGTHSPKGWIYGTLCTAFYMGNIYGSAVAVKIHNQKMEDTIIRKIDISFIWE